MINENSHITSLIKGTLYRLFGTVCTVVISFIFTGSVKISLSIGIVEVISKIFLYYAYERLWLFVMRKIFNHKTSTPKEQKNEKFV